MKHLCLGQLSEDAQKARNKDYRKYQEHHKRKMSRFVENEDVLHMLLLTSDPYLSSIRKLPKKKLHTLDNDKNH